MKRWFVTLSLTVLLVLALVPAVSAQDEDEFGSIMTGTNWLAVCGDATFGGIPVGLASVSVVDRIPPEFTLTNTFFASSAQYGTLEEVDHYYYTDFENFDGYWWFIVPADGYSIMTLEVFDQGSGLHSVATVTADCTTGEITIAQGSIYGPKVPKGFELRSLSGSSAVLDAPGGRQVGDNAVYAGQSWYVNPTPVVGPDGESYTEIFVNGWKTGFIPTVCVGGAP